MIGNMKYTDNDMCTILLCSHLALGENDGVKPFSLGEWGTFLQKLKVLGVKPDVVFSQDDTWLNNMSHSEIYKDRVKRLLSRGISLAFALDDMEEQGINLVTRFSREYPILLRKKLQHKAPPLLFYSGNLSLANKIGISVVGSRNIDEDGSRFAKELVEKAVSEELMIFSGGARGVDQISEGTALACGGGAVSFISDSLISKIKKKDVNRALLEQRLLLLSDVKPEVGFSVGRAMNRNKFIYASSYGAFVVQSDYNKGGTWNGAMESLRNSYTNIFVWDNDKYEGNMKLIENGCIPYNIGNIKLFDVINNNYTNLTKQQSLFLP